MDFHDAAELAVGRSVKIVLCLTDRKGGTEGLMAALVLALAEFGLAQASFQLRKQMRYGLRVVPDVSAGAVAAARIVAAAFEAPEPAVALTPDGGGFQDGEIRGNRLDDFRRERRVVEGVPEKGASCLQPVVVVAPVFGDFFNVANRPAYQGTSNFLSGQQGESGSHPFGSAESLGIVSIAEIGLRDEPGEH